MKYAFIFEHKTEFPVDLMCEVLEVTRSCYYDFFQRKITSNKELERLKIMRAIEDIHKASRRLYGSPRIFNHLIGLGFKISKKTVEKLMRLMGIRSKIKRKYKATTDSNHGKKIAPNLLAQDFSTHSSNQIWLSDITYIATPEGWLYLASILDLHTRKIVGWSIASHMSQELCINALEIAYRRQKPAPGLIFHTDQGSQYASKGFKSKLLAYKMIQSMSRRGNCWDNAPKESFFHTLKTELIYLENYKTRKEAISSIFEWIEVYYNRQRIHSSLGYKTPIAFEEAAMLKAA